MAVEIREIVLTARVTEPRPSAGAAPAGSVVTRELVDACLAELRAWLERRSER